MHILPSSFCLTLAQVRKLPPPVGWHMSRQWWSEASSGYPHYLASSQPWSPDHPRLNPFLWSSSQQERMNSGTEKSLHEEKLWAQEKKFINFLKEHKEILKSLYRRKKSRISQGQNRMSGPKAHRRTLWCWQWLGSPRRMHPLVRIERSCQSEDCQPHPAHPAPSSWTFI